MVIRLTSGRRIITHIDKLNGARFGTRTDSKGYEVVSEEALALGGRHVSDPRCREEDGN